MPGGQQADLNADLPSTFMETTSGTPNALAQSCHMNSF